MTQITNLSKFLPATVTLQLALFRPDTLVGMANDVSDKLHERSMEKPHPTASPAHFVRAVNECKALASLFKLLRNHVALIHKEPYLSEIRNPEEDVA